MTVLKQIAAVGLGYALLGAFGLSLAIPPGYASPVFPAAGLAVALALYYGNRVLPGVWLGSLSVNLAVAWQHNNLGMVSLAVAMAVASGATLQTWIARSAVQRWSDQTWRSLVSEKDIILFLSLAAPLSCLVASTFGTGALYLAGVIPSVDFLFSWWNWWIGDMLGVMLFAPLTLIVLLRAQPPWKERLKLVVAPMLVSLGVVTAVFTWVSRWEVRQQVEQVASSGKKIAQLLDHRLIAHQEALASLRRLIEVTPRMSFSQFDHFTRITLQDNQDIFALSFNPYISHAQKTGFERLMAVQTELPGFMITERNSEKKLVPAAARSYYVPIGYIAPLVDNKPAIGYDIYSDPVRRSAIERALKFMKPSATEPIQLVQEDQQRTGVLLISPAYYEQDAPGGKKTSVLTSFAVAVIKIDQMVQIAIANHVPDGLVVRLSDLQSEPGHQMIFQSDGGKASPMALYRWQTQLSMADRFWNLEVFATTGYLHQHRSWFAWVVGVAGLLFTSLLQIMMMGMTGRNFLVQGQVNEQTTKLTQTKLQLEALNQSLQQRVDVAVSELRQKDQVLISQGRQAAMGEMIGNIAHQWRQPLNALSMLISNLQFTYLSNELTEEYLNRSAANADRLIQKMSTTINDFRNFFSPDKEKHSFSALQQVRQAIELVDAACRNSNIKIEIVSDCDCSLYGFPNEYSQVLLNLLNNAKDSIVEHGVTMGQITISLEQQEGNGVVTMRDNGGGIPEDILDKVFEPYFSTKSVGTGIGLYMSKMIIERNMDGILSACNHAGGAEFRVSVPCTEQPV